MSLFLKKIFLFVCVLILYTGLTFLANKIVFALLKPPIHDVNILIAGDSQPQKGLNPVLFYSAQNIAQTGEPYIITYWKLKHLLQKTEIDTLILGFSYQNISAFNDHKFSEQRWATMMFERIYPIAEFEKLENIEIDYGEYYRVFFRNMCLYPNSNPFSFIGNYSIGLGSFITETNLENTINRNFYDQQEPFGVSNLSLDYLDQILQLCQEKKITLILVASPVYRDYYQQIPLSIKNSFEEKKEELKAQNISVIDFLNESYEEEFFLNVDHLNGRGAVRFSMELKEAIKNGENHLSQKN